MIVNLDNGLQYVQATERFISGDDINVWRTQVSSYINKEIRKGNDFTIKTIDGDELTITKETARKTRDNRVKNPDGTYREMTKEEFRTKLNAEVHINELAEISKKTNRQTIPDMKNHSFAKDGFDYRRTYFRDFDGRYYRVTLSIGKNGDLNTVYNVGKIKTDTPTGSRIISALSGSKAVDVSVDNNVPQSGGNVKSQKQDSADEVVALQ